MLRRLILDRNTVSAVARELGRSWDTVNTIPVETTTQLLLTAGLGPPGRGTGHRRREHKWAHTSSAAADRFITVITDLTAVRAGPARLLDVVPGRSSASMKSWLAAHGQAFRDQVGIEAMDGFGGYRNAAIEVSPMR